MGDHDDVRRDLLAEPTSAALVTDFDGVLAPISDDPTQSRLLEGTAELLAVLARRLGAVALLSGRPVAFLLDRAPIPGVVLLGSYGVEQHSEGETSVLPDVAGWAATVAQARDRLVDLEGRAGLHVEDKGLAVAVHWRRSPDPATAAALAAEAVREIAAESGLAVEPGKSVLELRPPVGQDKGTALRRLVAERRPRTVAYAGDDLGDLPAFTAVRELGGHALVVSGEDTAPEVAAVPGVHFSGPTAFAVWLAMLVDELGRTPA